MVFPILDRNVHQLGILCLFGRSQDERGVRGSILWLVFSNGSKVARVTDNCSAKGFQLVEGATHGFDMACVYGLFFVQVVVF